ncbi:putative disease resistance protein RGA1 [Phragmites australis]|uniref:putative disease resistance protein RGA1 n=1 Tax=Phragmites australis TaxID=29695 RepID=UPI002D78A412|nr:putative disease resistance protein RGA1 [Phragmites australis]
MAAEAILGAFMQTLFEKLSEVVLDQFRSYGGIQGKLENLSCTLSQLQAFLDDAEAKQLTDVSVRGWLAKLKDIAYDVDDLLDRYSAKCTHLKQRQMKLPTKASVSSPTSFLRRNLYQYRIKQKISSILVRLDKIAKERDTIGLQMLGGMSRRETLERPQSSSLVDSSAVFGREGDRREMVRLVLSDSGHNSSNVCVIPVVGMGGLGKTTLMQMVYHDDRVKEHFQLRIWVYVSENFDERKITQETLEAAAYDQSFVSTNMNMLQETLSRVLRGKRYLLVLDDVWNEDHDKWLSYRAALLSGGLGSKIVVTSRNENVARIMGGIEPYKLQQLSDDDSWSVFKSYAFRDGDCSTYPQLEVIGREIVKKLQGLPLASKALGSLLFCKTDEEEWKDILRNDIWELTAEKNNILPALRLSYNHLPPHLKQCFAFCSVYPKDYIFRREKLVKIWLALGFIRQSRKKRLEDSGNAYFNELLSRSFFQPYKDNYVMQNAMHDLAKSVSMEDCDQFEHERRQDNAIKTRHLSFPCKDGKCVQFGPLYGYRKLRTLIIMHGYKSKMSRLPDGVFMKLRFLRVLDIHGRGLKELPESIGNLEQLRFLDLTSTEIKTLPVSIVKLYNLQILKLSDCNSLREVPQGITKLINMRHLEVRTRLLSRIPGIGSLTCLQELEEFVVQKRLGHKITELRDMDQLHGQLSIRGLNNVVDGQDVLAAKLKTKEHLRTLHLIWDEDCTVIPSEQQEEILEGLQPHLDLKELMIKGFPGVRFPSWLASSSLPNLQTIHICNCRSKVLPPLGQLPFLKNLDIAGATEVTQLGREFTGFGQSTCFPALEELLLEDMPNLREWIFHASEQLFPQLTELGLIRCPKLKKLPPLPSTLTSLRIYESGLESLPELQNGACPSSLTSLYMNDCPNLASLRVGLLAHKPTALKSLTIAHCEGLVSLPEECFRPLISLRSLHIYKCPCLVPWTALEGGLLPTSIEDIRLNSCSLLACVLLNGLRYLPRLRHFEIADCPDISNLPVEGLPHTLQFLEISCCDDLQCLPPSLYEVSSLETLLIGNCPEIESLPEEGLPRGLKELYIKQCPLIKQRCQEGGPDRGKIAHIRDIEIDGDVIMLDQI